MTLSEAIEAATKIIGCYPNGGANAGDSYIGALAQILGSYPKSVAIACGNGLTGIVRDCKFLPTVADIVAWCERKTEPLRVQHDRERRIESQLAERDAVQEPQIGRLSYDELKAKYGDGKDGWGIDMVRCQNANRWPSPADLAGICGEEEWRKIPNRHAE